jgi:hypothetical protein
MSDDITQPELLAYDDKRTEGGNVRPADDRHLAAPQKRKRDAYVAQVKEARAEALVSPAPSSDPLADVLQSAVDGVAVDQEATGLTSAADTDDTTQENA